MTHRSLNRNFSQWQIRGLALDSAALDKGFFPDRNTLSSHAQQAAIGQFHGAGALGVVGGDRADLKTIFWQ